MDKLKKIDDLFNALKFLIHAVFPSPRLPQRRYLILFTAIIYVSLKFYISHVPDKEDTQILDAVHQVALQVLEDNDTAVVATHD